jgi:hypothetical protein
MEFNKYMHVEKFGNEEVEGIEIGKRIRLQRLILNY